jgi:hypothetical protein
MFGGTFFLEFFKIEIFVQKSFHVMGHKSIQDEAFY